MKTLIPPLLALLAMGATPWDVAAAESPRPRLKPGPWRGWLDTTGGDLPFKMVVDGAGDSPTITIHNGDERVPIPRVRVEGGEITLDFPHYEARIRATLDPSGARMDGEWQRRLGARFWSRLPFHAEAGVSQRFLQPVKSVDPAARVTSIEGRWKVQFGRRNQPSVGIFEIRSGGVVTGTFLNSTGDYRYLAGDFDGESLRLSRFDGAHAFLVHGTLGSGGALAGRIWEADLYQDSWKGSRDDRAALENPVGQSQWETRLDLTALAFPDTEGRLHRLSEPGFGGKAIILELMGTWCPNCYDSTRYLHQVYERHKASGLSIIGLAFEMTDDFERNARQVARYRAENKVPYPLLLAGKGEPPSPGAIFPSIQVDYAFPTLIFLHGDGRVRAVHTGFVSTASPEDHRDLVASLDALILELLEGGNGQARTEPSSHPE